MAWGLWIMHGVFALATSFEDRFDIVPGWMSWTILSSLFSMLGILLLSMGIQRLTSKSSTLASIAHLTTLAAYGILLVYHYRASAPLSFPIIRDNWKFMDRSETWRVALSAFETKDQWLLGSFFIALIWLDALGKPFRSRGSHSESKFGILTGILFIATYVFLSWTPWPTVDEGSLFIRSIYRDGWKMNAALSEIEESQFPYWENSQPFSEQNKVQIQAPTSRPNHQDLPHIWIILVESFNRNFLQGRNEEGIEYTPFLNQKTEQGILIDPFYANSTFTIKGWTSTLCSIYPAVDGYIAERDNLRIYGLPEALQAFGYRSLYFQAYEKLDFANTGKFMKRLGIDHAHAAGSFNWELEQNEKRHYWGWGLQDDVFYKKVFRQLDQQKRGVDGQQIQPMLILLAPISSHAPFDELPQQEMQMYPHPQNIREHYANAIGLADRGLKTFFAELESRPELNNSLVIVTGDHSFPMGEHDIYRSESGAFEEFFRVPLCLWWPNHWSSAHLTHTAHSQMDIAPSILNWIGVRQPNPFQGRPIDLNPVSDPVSDPDPVAKSHSTHADKNLLFQPYGGRWFVSVRYPNKYIYHAQTGWEGVFDLASDPTETTNLASKPHGWRMLRQFREDVARLYINQRLIDDNRLRPPKE